MDAQLRILAEFMDLVDDKKHAMTSQEYLQLCQQIQLTHLLIASQPEKTLIVEDEVITPREWRVMRRKQFKQILQVMQDINARRRRYERLQRFLHSVNI